MVNKTVGYICILAAEMLALFLLLFYTGLDAMLGFSMSENIPKALAIIFSVSLVLLLIVKWLLYVFGEGRYLKSSIGKIDQMTGEDFEDYLRLRFRKRGYRVEMTPASNDYGADLICRKKDSILVVQAKRYEGHVGTAAVQEVVAAREYYEADRCMVVTNNYFTRNAILLADANEVELIDRDELMNL